MSSLLARRRYYMFNEQPPTYGIVESGTTGYHSVGYMQSNNRFYAMSTSGQFAESLTGKTWTVKSTLSGAPSNANFAAGNGIIVIRLNNALYRSTNLGTSFSVVSGVTMNGNTRFVMYGNGLFMVLGHTYSRTSTDGLTWNSNVNFAEGAANHGVFVHDKFFLFTSQNTNGKLQVSTNGTSWTKSTNYHTLVGNNTAQAMFYMNNKYCFRFETATYSSTDGLTWAVEPSVPTTFKSGHAAFAGSGVNPCTNFGNDFTFIGNGINYEATDPILTKNGGTSWGDCTRANNDYGIQDAACNDSIIVMSSRDAENNFKLLWLEP